MRYRINFKSNVKVLTFTIITTISFFALWGFLDFDPDALLTLGLFQMVFSVPALYLHLEYFFNGHRIEIETLNEKLIVRKGNSEAIYLLSDIDTITICKSASMDRNGIQLLPMEAYYFVKIKMKNAKPIFITCLQGNNIDNIGDYFKGVPVIRKKNVFCSLN